MWELKVWSGGRQGPYNNVVGPVHDVMAPSGGVRQSLYEPMWELKVVSGGRQAPYKNVSGPVHYVMAPSGSPGGVRQRLYEPM